MSEEEEVWKPLPGYETKYLISNMGQLWSIKRKKVRRLRVNRYGYLTFSISEKVTHGTMTIHKAVMLTFVGVRPPDAQVNHKNGVKADNRLSNLEYCTLAENMRHRREVLKHDKSLNEHAVKEIRRRYAEGGISQVQLAKEYGVSQPTISSTLKRAIWKHVE